MANGVWRNIAAKAKNDGKTLRNVSNRWKKAEMDESCKKKEKGERIERRKEKAVKEEKLSLVRGREEKTSKAKLMTLSRLLSAANWYCGVFICVWCD